MINTYYILQDNQQTGPFTHEELMDMGIAGDTFVLSPLASDWQHASDLPEFFLFFQERGIYVPNSQNQAGFWWRLLAYIIDYVLHMALMFSVGVILALIGQITGNNISEMSDSQSNLYFGSLGVCIYLLYHPIFESMPMQGSVGKIICKLAVVDASGNRLTFLNALGRNLAKILSSLLCGLGFLNILWDNQGQGWHDQMAKTYVIRKGQ